MCLQPFVQDCSFDLFLHIKLFKLRPEVKIGTQGSFIAFLILNCLCLFFFYIINVIYIFVRDFF